MAQRPLKVDAGLQRPIHLRQEEPNTIATACLGLVQRQIGALQQPLRIGAILRCERAADADGGGEFVFVEVDRGAQGGYQAVGKRSRLVPAVSPGLNHDEFIATEPRHDVIRPRLRAQAIGDRLEQEIAAVMSKGVIDLLEAVEIDEVHGETATA